MSYRSISAVVLLMGCVPSFAHAQAVQSVPVDPANGQHFCEQQKEEFVSHTDFGASPAWRSIHVKSGSFSVDLPFSDRWHMYDQVLQPYTMYDNGSGSAHIAINGKSSDQARAMHFGRYRMDDIVCTSDTSIPTVTAMAGVREFSLAWQPMKSLSAIAKSAQPVSNAGAAPIPIKVGKNEGILIHGHTDLFGLSCTQDTLWFNIKGKTFSVSSTCRPMSFDLLRVMASIKLDK